MGRDGTAAVSYTHLLFPIASAIASFISPSITNKIGYDKLMIWPWGFILPVAYFGMLQTGNLPILCLCSLVAGFGAYAFVPIAFTTLYKLPNVQPRTVTLGISCILTMVGVGKMCIRDMVEPPKTEFRHMSHEEQDELIRKDPRYGKVICRCEQITEGEILDAIHSRIVPASIDAVKRRTRAGMGRCQGGFCQPRVLEPVSYTHLAWILHTGDQLSSKMLGSLMCYSFHKMNFLVLLYHIHDVEATSFGCRIMGWELQLKRSFCQ